MRNAIGMATIVAVATIAGSCAPLGLGGRASRTAGHQVLCNSADRSVSRADRIEIAGHANVGVRNLGVQAWLLAVPPGELSLELNAVTLRSESTGERISVSGKAELAEIEQAGVARGPLELAPLGTMRGVRLAAFRLDPGRGFVWRGTRWRVRSFDAAIRFPEHAREQQGDSAISDPNSSMRRMLELSLANPEGIDLYVQRSPGRVGGESVQEWQPRPELSPGMAWLKIPISADGLYGIDARWLQEHGLDATALRPEDIRIVSRGRDVVPIPTGIEGASFSGGARLAFPALASESPETVERMYYLGRRSDSASAAHAFGPRDGNAVRRASFLRRHRIEQDNHLQTRIGNFLSIREMAWVWERMSPEAPRKFPFDLPDLPTPAPGADAKIDFYIAGSGRISSADVSISVNGTSLEGSHSLEGETAEVEFAIPAGLLRRQGNELELSWNETGSSAPVWLDAIEIECESLFRSDGGAYFADFSADPGAGGPAIVEAVGFRPYRVVAIDVADPDNPVRLPVDVDGDAALVHATLGKDTRIRIVEGDSVQRAPEATVSVWRDWQRADFSADGVIVCNARFAAEAEAIAEQWRAEGRRTLVVDVASIYEAYSDGEVSGDAIRDFLSHAVHDWSGRRPTHALLVGDCTSDGRGVSRSGVENLLPTHVASGERRATVDEYACDAYFSWLAGDDEIADIFVGRISVDNGDDARAVAAKIASYRTVPADEWSSRAVCFSDAGNFADSTRSMLAAACGPDTEGWALPSSDFPWEDNFYLPGKVLTSDDTKVSPAFAQRIEAEFQRGAGIVTWMGHGSPNLWSNQRVWFGGGTDNSDSLRLTNAARLPFVAAFTCNNGAIDYPVPRWNVTISEDMMRQANGGAIACFVPSGPGFPAKHLRIGEGLLRAATQLHVREFGMLAEMARLNMQATLGPDDHSRMYILLGDPTLQLPQSPVRAALDTIGTFADSDDVQGLDVFVEGVAVSGGSVQIADESGEVLGENELVLDGTRWGSRILMKPTKGMRVHAIARGRTEAGEFWQCGKWIERAAPDLVVSNVERPDGGLAFRIENRGSGRAEGTLRVRSAPFAGASATSDFPIVLRSDGATVVAVPIAADVAAVEAEVRPSRRANARQGLPSSRWSDFVVSRVGESSCDIQVNADAIDCLGGAGGLRWSVGVANAGTGAATAAVEWNVVAADGSEEEGRTALGRIEPGKARFAFVVPAKPIDPAGSKLHVRCVAEDATDGDPSNDEATWVCDPAALADLVIEAGTIQVSPRHLVEGATVFVEGTVVNAGGGESVACPVNLFAADDAGLATPLRSMADRTVVEVPPLAPGERWPMRLRWDPMANLATTSVVLVVDPEGVSLDRDRSNNRIEVPLDIKSKWSLQPRGITFAPHDATRIRLVARVANVGQTEARRVAVFFYADEEQTPENLIGEKVVDVVPAESEIEVEWMWDVHGWDLQKARKPSYAIAIKGSLQRTSSVSP